MWSIAPAMVCQDYCGCKVSVEEPKALSGIDWGHNKGKSAVHGIWIPTNDLCSLISSFGVQSIRTLLERISEQFRASALLFVFISAFSSLWLSCSLLQSLLSSLRRIQVCFVYLTIFSLFLQTVSKIIHTFLYNIGSTMFTPTHFVSRTMRAEPP